MRSEQVSRGTAAAPKSAYMLPIVLRVWLAEVVASQAKPTYHIGAMLVTNLCDTGQTPQPYGRVAIPVNSLSGRAVDQLAAWGSSQVPTSLLAEPAWLSPVL
jgi:hypothetical protein